MRFGGWNMLNKISADVSRLLVFWNTCWPPVGTKSLHFLLRWLKAALLAGKLRRRQQRRRRKEIFGLKQLSMFKVMQLGDITQKNKEKERKKKRTPCVHSPRKTCAQNKVRRSNHFRAPTSDCAPFQMKRLETTLHTCARNSVCLQNYVAGQSPLSLTTGCIQPEPCNPGHAAIPHTHRYSGPVAVRARSLL